MYPKQVAVSIEKNKDFAKKESIKAHRPGAADIRNLKKVNPTKGRNPYRG